MHSCARFGALPILLGMAVLALAPRGHFGQLAVHSQELWLFPAWMGVRVRESTSHNFRCHPWISGRLRREVNSDRTLPWNKPLSGDLTNGQQFQGGCFSQWWVDSAFDNEVGNPCIFTSRILSLLAAPWHPSPPSPNSFKGYVGRHARTSSTVNHYATSP